jgi:hypothetical protein
MTPRIVETSGFGFLSSGPMPHGYGPNTDPRMIQAITQTMIGEFLWKYTRSSSSDAKDDTEDRRDIWLWLPLLILAWDEPVLDNMAPHAGPMPHGYGPNTDPRMIQAITQTMIGEFLVETSGFGFLSSF